MGAYFNLYKKYYDSLNGSANIIDASSSLSEAMVMHKSRFESILKSNSLICSFLGNGAGFFFNVSIPKISKQMQILSDFVSNNLASASSKAINDLLPLVIEIKEKDSYLEALVADYHKKKSLFEVENNKLKTMARLSSEYSAQKSYVLSIKNDVNKIVLDINTTVGDLKKLCESANSIIESIVSLNNGNTKAIVPVYDGLFDVLVFQTIDKTADDESVFDLLGSLAYDNIKSESMYVETGLSTLATIALKTLEGATKFFENLGDAISYVRAKYSNTSETLMHLSNELNTEIFGTYYTIDDINNFIKKGTITREETVAFTRKIGGYLGLSDTEISNLFKKETELDTNSNVLVVKSNNYLVDGMNMRDVETCILNMFYTNIPAFKTLNRSIDMSTNSGETLMDSAQIEAFKKDLKDISVNYNALWYKENIYNQKLPFDITKTYGEYLEENSLLAREGFIGKCFESVGQMIPTIASSILPFGSYLASASLFSTSYGNALESGLNIILDKKAEYFEKHPLELYSSNNVYSLLTATTELLTEKISSGFMGIKLGKNTTVDDFIEKGVEYISKLGSDPAMKNFLKIASKVGLNTISEGGEELLSQGVSPLVLKLSIMADQNLEDLIKEHANVGELARSFLSGAFCSLIMQTASFKGVQLAAEETSKIKDFYNDLPASVKNVVNASDAAVVDLALKLQDEREQVIPDIDEYYDENGQPIPSTYEYDDGQPVLGKSIFEQELLEVDDDSADSAEPGSVPFLSGEEKARIRATRYFYQQLAYQRAKNLLEQDPSNVNGIINSVKEGNITLSLINLAMDNGYQFDSSSRAMTKNLFAINAALKRGQINALDFASPTVLDYDTIVLALSRGYKVDINSSMIVRNNDTIIREAVKQGQTYAIDYSTRSSLTDETIALAFEHGYKVDENSALSLREDPFTLSLSLENSSVNVIDIFLSSALTKENIQAAYLKGYRISEDSSDALRNNPTALRVALEGVSQKTNQAAYPYEEAFVRIFPKASEGSSEYRPFSMASGQYSVIDYFLEGALTRENIDLARQMGYRLNSKSSSLIKNNQYFLEKSLQVGDTGVLDYVSQNLLTKENIALAFNKGYKINKESSEALKNNSYAFEEAVNRGQFDSINHFSDGLFTDKRINLMFSRGYKLSTSSSFFLRNNESVFRRALEHGQFDAVKYVYPSVINDSNLAFAFSKGYVVNESSPAIIKNNPLAVEMSFVYSHPNVLDFVSKEFLTIDNIKRAAEMGYNLSDTSPIVIRNSSLILESNLKRGNTRAMDYATDAAYSENIVALAFEKGYELTRTSSKFLHQQPYVLDLALKYGQYKVIDIINTDLLTDQHIELAFDLGYRLSNSSSTFIKKNLNALNLALSKGQINAIDYADESLVNQNFVKPFFDKGYILTKNSPKSLLRNEFVLEESLEHGQLSAIDLVDVKALTNKNIELAIKKGYVLTAKSPLFLKNNPFALELALENGQINSINYAQEEALTEANMRLALTLGYKISENTSSILKINEKFLNMSYESNPKLASRLIDNLAFLKKLYAWNPKSIDNLNMEMLRPEIMKLGEDNIRDLAMYPMMQQEILDVFFTSKSKFNLFATGIEALNTYQDSSLIKKQQYIESFLRSVESLSEEDTENFTRYLSNQNSSYRNKIMLTLLNDSQNSTQFIFKHISDIIDPNDSLNFFTRLNYIMFLEYNSAKTLVEKQNLLSLKLFGYDKNRLDFIVSSQEEVLDGQLEAYSSYELLALLREIKNSSAQQIDSVFHSGTPFENSPNFDHYIFLEQFIKNNYSSYMMGKTFNVDDSKVSSTMTYRIMDDNGTLISTEQIPVFKLPEGKSLVTYIQSEEGKTLEFSQKGPYLAASVLSLEDGAPLYGYKDNLVLGLSKWNPESLIHASKANMDDKTAVVSNVTSKINAFNPYNPKPIIDSTLSIGYNELVFEKDSVKPSFVVIFERSNEIAREKALKAAYEMNLPIVYVEGR